MPATAVDHPLSFRRSSKSPCMVPQSRASSLPKFYTACDTACPCWISDKHNHLAGLGLRRGLARQAHLPGTLIMGKKRKSRTSLHAGATEAPGETFADSEDEFYLHRDNILLDETPVAKRRRKIEEQDEGLQPSDEEILRAEVSGEEGFDEESDSSNNNDSVGDEDAGEAALFEEEEDERIWGSSKRDYYNADPIETEQDALEEETEARRLREKQLKSMTEADFGFDENEWGLYDSSTAAKGSTIEKLPPLRIPSNATADEQLAILTRTYPEFLPLAEDLLDLHATLSELELLTGPQQLRDGDSKYESKATTTVTKYRALSAYLSAIAMYLAIMTSNNDGRPLPPSELRGHPIMHTLLRCRQLWLEVQNMDNDIDVANTPQSGAQEQNIVHEDHMSSIEHPLRQARTSSPKVSQALIGKSTASEPKLEAAKSRDMAGTQPLKKAEKIKKTHGGLNDLLSQVANADAAGSDSDFGDEAPLSREEAIKKARKKKSLRFYTSQISQKANKRDAAAREAGGDDDLPYKERIRDKQDRLTREAEDRARKRPSVNDDADGIQEELAQVMNNDANEYYDQIVSTSKQRKTDKQVRADAYAHAAREGAQVYEEERVGPNGKRRITYAIEKNKGLTPKRKKEVRNPRVKKKKKYEEKMKKLSSMRPVYKGGQGKGGYGGEMTGIKTSVVKSMKL